jgi:hypothetical protein
LELVKTQLSGERGDVGYGSSRSAVWGSPPGTGYSQVLHNGETAYKVDQCLGGTVWVVEVELFDGEEKMAEYRVNVGLAEKGEGEGMQRQRGDLAERRKVRRDEMKDLGLEPHGPQVLEQPELSCMSSCNGRSSHRAYGTCREGLPDVTAERSAFSGGAANATTSKSHFCALGRHDFETSEQRLRDGTLPRRPSIIQSMSSWWPLMEWRARSCA